MPETLVSARVIHFGQITHLRMGGTVIKDGVLPFFSASNTGLVAVAQDTSHIDTLRPATRLPLIKQNIVRDTNRLVAGVKLAPLAQTASPGNRS